MELDKNKIYVIEKGNSEEFLKFLNEQKEKNKDSIEKFRNLAKHIDKYLYKIKLI